MTETTLGPAIVVEAEEQDEHHQGEEGLQPKFNRGGSFRSLFGVSRSQRSTAKTLSPPHRSTRSQSTPGPDVAKATGQAPAFLHVANQSPSFFRLPRPHMKLLKKTGSVRQLYRSLVQALRSAVHSEPEESWPELTKDFFETVLRESEDNRHLSVVKVVVNNDTQLGSHFCSQVHAVDVIAKDAEHGFLEYHLIVKCLPWSEDARRLLQPSHTFEKEVLMYASVFRDMAEFVRSRSVVHVDDVVDVPKCYLARWEGDLQPRKDLIILENLFMQGFVFAGDSSEGLDRLHSELVVRELAKLHAISYCMKSGDNDILLEVYPCLKDDSLYCSNTESFTKRTITPVMASLAEVIRADSKFNAHYDWFVDLAKNFHRIQMETICRRPSSFSVICHGDLWLSNLLFRYEHQLPIDVRFIDFQSARFASLATDLSLFLFTAVQSGLRKQMLGELVSLYYTTFLASTRSLNHEHPVFTLEELFVELEQHIIYGFLEGIWYLDILHLGHVPSADTGRNEDDKEENDDNEEDNEDDNDYNEEENNSRPQGLDEARCQERRYRHRFFQLLEETLFLLGKTSGDGERRGLRDISLAPEPKIETKTTKVVINN